jgi:hypothetical protein
MMGVQGGYRKYHFAIHAAHRTLQITAFDSGSDTEHHFRSLTSDVAQNASRAAEYTRKMWPSGAG